MSHFKFNLGDKAKLTVSQESGHIIARCESIESNPTYLLRYSDAQGIAKEQWWAEDALELAQ